jgi:hypothetical protein
MAFNAPAANSWRPTSMAAASADSVQPPRPPNMYRVEILERAAGG